MDLTDQQLSWAGAFTGIPLTPSNASTGGDPQAAAGGTAPAADTGTETMANAAAGAPGGGPADNDAPLKATDTDMFFAKGKADLTADDKASLDAYAKSYNDAGSTDDVTVEGFASQDGDAGFNKTLSQQRAQAVVDYLITKKVPKDKIKPPVPHGATKQWGDDLPSNRRATVAPKPPAAPASVSPAQPSPAKPVDLDPNSPANQQAIQKTVQDSQEAEDWIRKHLKDKDLRPDPLNDKGDHVLYDNKTTAVDDVVKETLQSAKNASLKAPELVTEERVRKIVTDVLLDSIPAVKSGGKDPSKADISLQYQFVPFTDHKSLKDGKNSTDQPGHQIQLQITAKLHGKDESGVEIQGQVTGVLFADGVNQQIQWQQVQGGAQVAWVQNFFDNNLQVSPQLAVSFGGARAVMNQTQTLQWTPAGQVTGGGQVTYKVPGFKGQLQVGVQGQIGVTDPSGSQKTLDKTWVFTLTYTF